MAEVRGWNTKRTVDLKERRWFTTGEVADLTGISRFSIIRYINAGKLRVRSLPGAWSRIDRRDLIDFLQKRDLEVKGIWSKPRKKVLVIDDDRRLLNAIRKTLRRHPQIIVETAASVEQGVMLCGKFEPDLVVLDWHFPRGAQGEDALRFIRAAGPTDIKIICTASRADARPKMLRTGASSSLLKPFELEALRDEILRLLWGRRRRVADRRQIGGVTVCYSRGA